MNKLFSILLILTFISCRKDIEPNLNCLEINGTDFSNQTTLSPIFSVERTSSNSTGYYSKLDSLDLNNDQIFDIAVRHLGNDGSGSSNAFPYVEYKLIRLNTSFEFLCDSFNILDTLKTSVCKDVNWGNFDNYRLYYFSPDLQQGFWNSGTSGFIGVRNINDADTIYGWIEMNINESVNITKIAWQ